MSHFRQFVTEINKIVKKIDRYDQRDQEQLLNDLFESEDKFRQILIDSSCGIEIYEEFIRFIKEDKRNILSSRIFFRERQKTFTEQMSECFKQPNPLKLQNFRINYEFVKWVLRDYKGPKKKQLVQLYDQMSEIRNILMHRDVFLALNRAKIFSSRAPNWRLDHMDIVQDACEGYLVAVDKFVPPYTTVFRSVAIGRMTLLMLTDHNATMVKFSPTESRILYRAKNARYKEKLEKDADVLEYVRESYPKVTPEQLARIEAASGVSSLDESVDGSMTSFIDLMIDETIDIIEGVEVSEHSEKLRDVFRKLTIFEQKMIRLKYGFTKDDQLCQRLLKE